MSKITERTEALSIVLIGCGGIGTWLSRPLFQYLQFHNPGSDVHCIDGDKFEPKNEERQFFSSFGNKADILVDECETSGRYPLVRLHAVPEYLDEENISELIVEKDIVFLCVDNNKTRKLVGEYCLSLSEVIAISGGNEYSDGSVQLLMRKGGKPIAGSYYTFASLWKKGKKIVIHPEIENPEDKHPSEIGCAEAVVSVPQLLFVNNRVAATMQEMFYSCVICGQDPIGIVYLDLLRCVSTPQTR